MLCQGFAHEKTLGLGFKSASCACTIYAITKVYRWWSVRCSFSEQPKGVGAETLGAGRPPDCLGKVAKGLSVLQLSVVCSSFSRVKSRVWMPRRGFSLVQSFPLRQHKHCIVWLLVIVGLIFLYACVQLIYWLIAYWYLLPHVWSQNWLLYFSLSIRGGIDTEGKGFFSCVILDPFHESICEFCIVLWEHGCSHN